MDGFAHKITEVLVEAGVSANAIYRRDQEGVHKAGKVELPGFFRPTKQWDLLVVWQSTLIAAIELKSQVGSFGNNFNNRTEEAVGSATDIWTAYRDGAFGNSPEPWLGYLFLLEDSPKSRSPVGVREPHFRVFPEFRDASYARRYEILCRKLVRERKYRAACFMIASQDQVDEARNYIEPAPDLSADGFLRQLVAHVHGILRT
jgi:hypothetical protein